MDFEITAVGIVSDLVVTGIRQTVKQLGKE